MNSNMLDINCRPNKDLEIRKRTLKFYKADT